MYPFIERGFKPRPNGMTHKSFVAIIVILTVILLVLTGINDMNYDVMLTKLSNVAALYLFSTLFSHFWLGRSNRIDEKIFKSPLAVSVYLGMFSVALGIALTV